MTCGFSFNRLAQVLRWDVAAGWRGYITGMCAAALILLMAFVMSSRNVGGDFVVLTDEARMEDKADFAVSAFVFAMVCGASLTAFGLGDKARRAACFMLPATPLEKFVARCLQVTVGVGTLLVAAVAVADALHFVFCLIVGTNGGLHSVFALFAERLAHEVAEPFTRELEPGASNVVLGIYGIVAFVWLQSLMLVGSVLFSRYQLVITTIVLAVCWAVLAFLTYPFFRGPIPFAFFEVSAAVLPVLIVADYAVAYRLYRRMQLVGRKWINV